MLKLSIIGLSLVVVSCSSSPFKEQSDQQDKITKHMSQEKKYIGGEFESKYSNSGNDGFTLRAVGQSVYPVASSEQVARLAAIANAKFKIIESGPTEFKSLVQQAIGNSLGQTGEFTQIDTSVVEVKALRGIEIKQEDVSCKIVIEPNVEGGYNNLRECKAIARIPLSELKKAYDFTVGQKYSGAQKSEVEKLLEEQLRGHALSNVASPDKDHPVRLPSNQN